MAKKSDKAAAIEIDRIVMGQLGCTIYGTTPMIMHRFAAKAWQELLMPSIKKNAAAKAADLKHDPLHEFRQCCYINREKKEPTLLHFPSGAFSKAIASAALDMPGAKKAQILRLVSIKSTQINIFGTPQLGMDMVRSSDMARTPDVRTRAYLPEWTANLEIEYVKSLIGETQIMNLLAAAGTIVGIGDYRPQKGGQFGKFETVQPDDKRVLKLHKEEGRAAQEAALASPSFYSDEAAELFEWFCRSAKQREKVPPSVLLNGNSEPDDMTGNALAAALAAPAKAKKPRAAAR